MAIDSRDKRMSLIGLGLPVPRVLPNPDGGFGTAADRIMLIFMYAGLTPGTSVIYGGTPVFIAYRDKRGAILFRDKRAFVEYRDKRTVSGE